MWCKYDVNLYIFINNCTWIFCKDIVSKDENCDNVLKVLYSVYAKFDD